VQFDRMVTALGLEEHASLLRPRWEESQRSLPSGEIEFLTAAFLRRAAEDVPSAPEGIEAAIAAAATVAGDEALRALAWHYHCFLYGGERPDWHRATHWPRLAEGLGETARLFNSLVLLSGLSRMHAEHRAHGVPAEVIGATLANVRAGLGGPQDDHGPGMSPRNVAWFSNFLRGELYRLGRLQFQFGTFGRPLRAFRHRESRVVLALSEGGTRFRADGQRATAEEEGWTTTLEVNEGGAMGYPILPTGAAARRVVSLPAGEWEEVLTPSDPALWVHIPGGGGEPMAFDACGDSFRQALEFYPRHYPCFAFRAFVCESWILNTWFEAALPPTSNMRRFQREVYLFPCDLHPEEPVHMAFGHHGTPLDLRQAPRDTSLRRAVLEVLEAGGQIPTGGGGCFLLREDVRWGEEVYRRQVLPFEL